MITIIRAELFKKQYGPAALITGASSGIGKAFAQLLAEYRFDLVLVARREDRLKSIQQDLQSRFGIHVHIIVQDLTQRDAAGLVYRQINEAGIEIGLLVNNAGYGSSGAFERLSLESELAMIDLACRTMVDFSHRIIPDMQQRGRGGIIFVSSVLSQFPAPYMAVYAAGKTFEFAFSNALYGELKPLGIDVLALLPGTTETEFFQIADMKRVQFMTANPLQVAQTALRAIGRKPYAVHGTVNKFLVFLSHFLPVRFMTWAVKRALGDSGK